MNGQLIIWDWNGTLLDDTEACVGALNCMLEKRALKTVTLEFFRDNFAFPARKFYEMIDMNVPDSEWDALAKEYYLTYLKQPVKLNAQAVEALEYVKARGGRQIILSALRQDFLEADVKRFGVAEYFEKVCGTDNLDGGSKLKVAETLSGEIDGAIMIGDALHDCEVANALGIRSILVATGSHAAWRLEASGETCADLMSAVRRIW